ncbi:MAG: zinc-ribbon domain-containing protein, partial [Eggerthellaceae bacterium]
PLNQSIGLRIIETGPSPGVLSWSLLVILVHYFLSEEEAMIFCPKCGAQLNDGSRFCTECGQPVRQIAETDSMLHDSVDDTASTDNHKESNSPQYSKQENPPVTEAMQSDQASSAGASIPQSFSNNPTGSFDPTNQEGANPLSNTANVPTSYMPTPQQGSLNNTAQNQQGNTNTQSKKSNTSMVVGIVVAVIALLVIVGALFSCSGLGGSTNGLESKEAVCEEMSKSTQDYLESDISKESTIDVLAKLYTLMPDEVINKQIELYEVDSLEELVLEIDDVDGTYLLYSDLNDSLEGTSLVFTFTPGNEVSSSKLEDINDNYTKFGGTTPVTSAYYLNCDITITYDSEDYSYSQAWDDSYLICIDDKWYIWEDLEELIETE